MGKNSEQFQNCFSPLFCLATKIPRRVALVTFSKYMNLAVATFVTTSKSGHVKTYVGTKVYFNIVMVMQTVTRVCYVSSCVHSLILEHFASTPTEGAVTNTVPRPDLSDVRPPMETNNFVGNSMWINI